MTVTYLYKIDSKGSRKKSYFLMAVFSPTAKFRSAIKLVGGGGFKKNFFCGFPNALCAIFLTL